MSFLLSCSFFQISNAERICFPLRDFGFTLTNDYHGTIKIGRYSPMFYKLLFETELLFTANVTEELTGLTQSGSHTVDCMRPDPFEIDFATDVGLETFRPGMPLTLKVCV